MSPIKCLKNILFVENLLGIYRNYCNQTKKKKCFLIFLTFIQIIMHTLVIIVVIKLLLKGNDYKQINLIYGVFGTSAFVNCVSSVVISICYSRDFMSYYKSISRVCGCFKDDKKFTNSVKKIYWFSLTVIFFSITFVAYRSYEALIRFFYVNPLILFIMINIILQHITLFDIIMLAVNSFKSLTSLISVQESGGRDISSDEQCDITKEQIQGWVELYQDLANSCEKISLCFGRQFFFTITMSISNYVLLTYQICYRIVLKNEGMDEFRRLVYVICTYLLLMMLPIVAGQKACNQGVKFHRLIARLYNTMIINDSGEAEAKLIKDFIRLIKKKPIEIKLLPKIPVGMYMLPVILTLAVNYVIIMLQFNHII